MWIHPEMITQSEKKRFLKNNYSFFRDVTNMYIRNLPFCLSPSQSWFQIFELRGSNWERSTHLYFCINWKWEQEAWTAPGRLRVSLLNDVCTLVPIAWMYINGYKYNAWLILMAITKHKDFKRETVIYTSIFLFPGRLIIFRCSDRCLCICPVCQKSYHSS